MPTYTLDESQVNKLTIFIKDRVSYAMLSGEKAYVTLESIDKLIRTVATEQEE